MPIRTPTRRLHLIAWLALSTATAAAQADTRPAVVIAVEASGADSADGDAETGPVKSLKRAQALARIRLSAMANGSEPRAPVRVLIGPGEYTLDAPLTFTPQDSGTAEAPVSYEAKQAGSVHISGGIDLGSKTAPQAGTKLSYAAPPDPAAMNGGAQLFVNGRRAMLAREPNEPEAWFVRSATPVSGEAAGKQGTSAFAATPASLSWIRGLSAVDRKRAIVEVYQSWTTGKHRLSSQPAPDGSLRIEPRALWPFLSLGGASQRYFIENVAAALDAPGEWIYDDGAVRYICRGDEAGKPLQATLPRLEKLIVVQGDVARPVSHLHLIGLSFAHTRYLTPEGGVTDNQAAYIVGAAIEVNRAIGFVFDQGSVEHTGGWGIWLREGVRDARISDTTFADLGAGGIKVGLAAQSPSDGAATGANLVIGNTVSLTGQVFPGAVGIFVGQSWDNQILRNTIHDTTYTGISVGWSWGYAAATSGRNLIKGNLIYNIGQHQLSDLAGVYTLGRSPGTVIANNIIRKVRGYSGYGAGAWGIYNDEGSSGILMQGNVVLDTDSGGYHLHFGKDNTLDGNIFAGGDAAELHVTKPEQDSNLTVRGNLLVPKTRRPLDLLPAGADIKFDHNEVSTVLNGTASVEQLDKCRGGCIAGYADLHGGAAPTDIRSSDPSWMAVILAAVRAWNGSDAAGPKRSVTGAPHARAPLPIVSEAPRALLAPATDLTVDLTGPERPGTLQYTPKGRTEGIRVEAQDGAPGGRCLAFNDGPSFANKWEPFATAVLNHNQGNTTLSFDLRIDAAAVMVVEWRDNATPYLVGPSLRISAAGAEVGGKIVAPITVGAWNHFSMSAPLGADTPRWHLEVAPAGGKNVSIGDLATKSATWRQLNSLVFSSDALVDSHACLASIRATNSATSNR